MATSQVQEVQDLHGMTQAEYTIAVAAWEAEQVAWAAEMARHQAIYEASIVEKEAKLAKGLDQAVKSGIEALEELNRSKAELKEVSGLLMFHNKDLVQSAQDWMAKSEEAMTNLNITLRNLKTFGWILK